MIPATGPQPHETDAFLIEPLPACPDLTRFVQLNAKRYPFLLQSVAEGADNDSETRLARYDVLFACPRETLRLDAAGLQLPAGVTGGSFLEALDDWWLTEGHSDAASLPFSGGWFLYLGYELASEVEPSLRLTPPTDMPVALATRIPIAIVHDHSKDEFLLLADPSASAEEVDRVRTDLARLQRSDNGEKPVSTQMEVAEADEEEFLRAVGQAKEYIRQGDIFQANLSRRWDAVSTDAVEPVMLYQQLCATNPAPFAGLMVQDEFALVSSSPERLVRRQGSRLDTRPIAGTRPRQGDPRLAERTRDDLLGNAKERAEHIMLIDLERNDLGRVCAGGTVEVDEYMVVENYSHVHHIVSNISGEARPGLTPGELIRAVFPGGTITGCPKVRCMEIISELEDGPRGAYTGSMGYLNLNGDCDLNILIRTMTVHANRVSLSAGSGIVADSDAGRELEETRAKAKGLLLALNGSAAERTV